MAGSKAGQAHQPRRHRRPTASTRFYNYSLWIINPDPDPHHPVRPLSALAVQASGALPTPLNI